MKRTKKTQVLLCMIGLLAATVSADFEFLKIGNPGNTGDVRKMSDGTSGYGAVGYAYAISRYAVSNIEWASFQSAAFGQQHNPAFSGDHLPVQNVSWYDAAQYCNWLTSGNPYTGAYLFNPDNSFAGIDRDQALLNYHTVYALPTEDEWHKAAYYDADSNAWWSYTNGTDTVPTAHADSMYGQTWPYVGPWEISNGMKELNGTYNMTGNVWEWTETSEGNYKMLRGGAYDTNDPFVLSSKHRHYIGVPHGGYDNIGFRVVTIVPEPASVLLLAAGGAVLVRKKRSP